MSSEGRSGAAAETEQEGWTSADCRIPGFIFGRRWASLDMAVNGHLVDSNCLAISVTRTPLSAVAGFVRPSPKRCSGRPSFAPRAIRLETRRPAGAVPGQADRLENLGEGRLV